MAPASFVVQHPRDPPTAAAFDQFIPRIDAVFVLAVRSQREDGYKHPDI
jgi:hypothetical protein